MRKIFLFTLLVLSLAPSLSRAELRESDSSYYARLMKSCEYQTRETWRDYLLYAPNKRFDECCAESIRTMQKQNARLADGRSCPEGTQINSLRCTTSKKWCEKTR